MRRCIETELQISTTRALNISVHHDNFAPCFPKCHHFLDQADNPFMFPEERTRLNPAPNELMLRLVLVDRCGGNLRDPGILSHSEHVFALTSLRAVTKMPVLRNVGA